MSTYDADDLLSENALNAAVSALANRNAHHLQDMTPAEQQEAAGHWRALAIDVLVAVRATVTNPEIGPAINEGGPGRAVIVLEDSGEEEINVHVAFHPELQQLGDDQVAGTPAQITAVSMIDTLGEEGGEGAEPGPA
ncbi:hypothetical protein DSM112329_04474 [Paraconexibacter sp. AEG42_29]|uniref:Uncharacterized protein n=1 Tax=Paraconexibacter sp. AEG42_29 TaxID=2997339 RepID=A0AAU7B0T2_9ACTN